MDIRIADHGTIVQLIPLTPAGKEALEGLDAEGWQWMGSTLCIDRRLARDVVQHLAEEGLL